MNLLLLVEGAETEPRVYQAWLRRWLPAHQRLFEACGALLPAQPLGD